MQRAMTARRHGEGAGEDDCAGFMEPVCRDHEMNYLLWHEEDSVRDASLSAEERIGIKESIDGHNQARNDSIEAMDEFLAAEFEQAGRCPAEELPMNTETPGGAIDRLSVLVLREYHLQECLDHESFAAPGDAERIRCNLALCREQSADLVDALSTLLSDLALGRKGLKVYRHLKMYNDPLFRGKRGVSGTPGAPARQ